MTKPFPLALPESAWFTADVNEVNERGFLKFNAWMCGQSDAQILERLKEIDRAIHFFLGWRLDGIEPVVRIRREIEASRAETIKCWLTWEVIDRFRRVVEKRKYAAQQAAATKRYRKARVA